MEAIKVACSKTKGPRPSAAKKENNSNMIQSFLYPLLAISLVYPHSDATTGQKMVIISQLQRTKFSPTLLACQIQLLKDCDVSTSLREDNDAACHAEWCCSVNDACIALLDEHNPSHESSSDRIEELRMVLCFVNHVLGVVMPVLIAQQNNLAVDVDPLIESMVCLLDQLKNVVEKEGNTMCLLSMSTVYWLSMSALMTSNETHVCKVMDILLHVSYCFDKFNLPTRRFVLTLSGIFSASSYPPLRRLAEQVHSKISSSLQIKTSLTVAPISKEVVVGCNNITANVVTLLSNLASQPPFALDVSRLLDTISITSSSAHTLRLSALFAGLCFLYENDDAILWDRILNYLGRILNADPSLSIRAFPILMQMVNLSIAAPITSGGENQLDRTVHLLNFMCTTMGRNPMCSKQLWQMVQGFVASDMPVHLRGASIRLCAPLVQSNRRLFGKVSDSVLSAMKDSNEEIRISVAATMNDLCKYANSTGESAASTFVGPLQQNLRDESPVVVALAIESLHHFCQHGVMHFDLLLKALSKRLPFSLKIIEEILRQDVLVVKTLCLLLGDGECKVDESSSESEDSMVTDEDDEHKISPQLTQAVSILLGLVTALLSDEKYMAGSDYADCRHTIFKSLSCYSMAALGVEADAVRSVLSGEGSGNTQRYETIRGVISLGIEMENTGDASLYLVKLAGNIVNFENETLGPLLWNKKLSSNVSAVGWNESSMKKKEKGNILALLPNAESLHDMYKENPSSATSMALLYHIGDDDDSFDEAFELLSDIVCDLHIQGSTDPVQKALNIAGWIESMRQLCSIASKENKESKDVYERLLSLSDLTDSPDNYLLALSSFAFVIQSDILQLAESIYGKVIDSMQSNGFANKDDGYLCMGLIGASFCNSMSLSFVDDVLDELESSLSKQASRYFTGALYGMGMIVQSLADNCTEQNSTQMLPPIRRILSFFLLELSNCLEVQIPAIVRLATCARTGQVTTNLIESCKEMCMKNMAVRDSAKHRCRSVCLALSLAMPCFYNIHPSILTGVYHVCMNLPWSAGKGYALATATMTAFSCKLLTRSDIDSVVGSLERLVEGMVDMDGFDDIFIVISICNLLLQRSNLDNPCVQKLLEVSKGCASHHGISFAESSAVISLCLCIGSIPALVGSHIFSESCRIHPIICSDLAKAVVTLLQQIAVSNLDREYESSIITLGVLCSMKYAVKKKSQLGGTLFARISSSPNKFESKQRRGSNASYIPIAAKGTVVNKILRLLETNTTSESDLSSVKCARRVSLLLSCILHVHLPSSFSKEIKKCVNANASESVSVGAISLLMAQIKLRRGTADRKGFVDLLLDLLRRPTASMLIALGGGAGLKALLGSIASILSKLPTSAVPDVLQSIWAACIAEASQGKDPSCAIAFILFLGGVLADQKQPFGNNGGAVDRQTRESLLAPIALSSCRNFIRDVLLDSITQTLHAPGASLERSLSRENVMLIWDAFLTCLQTLGSNNPEEIELFLSSTVYPDTVNTNQNFCRAFAHVALITEFSHDHYLLKKSRELEKVRLWFTRYCSKDDAQQSYKPSIRLLAFNFARATEKVDNESKKRIIIQSFDDILVQGIDGIVTLELLATQILHWYKHVSVGDDKDLFLLNSSLSCLVFSPLVGGSAVLKQLCPCTLAQFMDVIFMDFPMKLHAVAADLEIVNIIGNNAFQIVSSLKASANQSDPRCCKMVAMLDGVSKLCHGKSSNMFQFQPSVFTKSS